LKSKSFSSLVAIIFLSFLCLVGGVWAEGNKKAPDTSDQTSKKATEVARPGNKKEVEPSKQTDKNRAETPKETTKKEAEASKQGEKKEAAPPGPVTISANRMEVNRKLHVAVYIDNVVVKKGDLTIYARKVEFLFDDKMEEIQKVTAEGGVRIVDPEKTATSEKAVYLNDQDILILTGNAKVWQGENVITGSKMTLLRKEDRSIVESEGKGRITSVFYQNKEEGGSKTGIGILPKGKTDQEKSTKKADQEKSSEKPVQEKSPKTKND
jgi:lipopolysaccharide export system protein LptA